MATCPTCRNRYGDDQTHCPADGEPLLPDDVAANFDSDLMPGEMVGEYKVEKKIGEGGFGKVYKAVHPVIGKRAAIKVLNREYSSNPSVVSRFVSEARAVNQIRHRNIIDIFSFGVLDSGLQYFVMELLDGHTLDEQVARHGRMAPEEALPVFRALARALDAAHAAGIAHRDLKPENVFLAFDEEGTCFPKLLDFGIAKLMGDSSVGHKTRTGAAMGTPLYMSPEQCHGVNVDHRTDIYSFAVMMHEVLTGRTPFDGDSMMDLMFKHAKAAPPPMSQCCPELPAAMDGPVLQMLEKDPEDRPQSLTSAVDAVIDAAQSAGLSVPIKRTGLSVSGGAASASTMRKGDTVIGGPVAISSQPGVGGDDAYGKTQVEAKTLNTVETTIAPKSSSRTVFIAGAAVAFGIVGTVVFFTMFSGEDNTTPDSTPAANTELATPAPKPPANSDPEPEPEPEPQPAGDPEPAVEASATATATLPQPTPVGPPVINVPKPPAPPPVKPPSPPPTKPPTQPNNFPNDLPQIDFDG